MRVSNRFIFSGVSLAAMAASPAFAQSTPVVQKEQIPTSSVLSSEDVRAVTAAQCENLPSGKQRPAACESQITVTGTSPITNSGSWTLSFPTNMTLPGNTTGTFIGNLTASYWPDPRMAIEPRAKRRAGMKWSSARMPPTR